MLDSSKIAADGGVLGSLKRIIRTEGAPALFRGNSLNVLRIALTKAVEFFVYDTYKARRLKMKQKDQTENEKENNNNTNNKTAAGDLSGGERMIGGSVASMCGTALTHPIDTLRSPPGPACSKSPLVELIKNEGPKALWKGLGANMIRVAPYGAINFFVYDYCKQQYKKFRVRFNEDLIDAYRSPQILYRRLLARSREPPKADRRLPDRARTASNASSRHENARPWCKKCHAVQKRRSRRGAHRYQPKVFPRFTLV